MKTVINVNENKLAKGDILIYNGEAFEPISKEAFLERHNIDIFNLKKVVEQLRDELDKVNKELAYNRGDISKEEYENGK